MASPATGQPLSQAGLGRPLHVDLATQNGTRPSCAKVKVEVNLLSKFPQRIKIVEDEDESGPEEFKWIKIRYDYMPKYCKSCKKQGHKENECWVINPELRQFEDQVNDKKNEQEVIAIAAASTKVKVKLVIKERNHSKYNCIFN
nr:uncharacterized protein LOC104090048 [Nicotiana tomentosiformis]